MRNTKMRTLLVGLALVVALALPQMALADISGAKKAAWKMGETFENIGYNVRETRTFGTLERGAYFTSRVTLFEGSTYAFIAAGDDKAKDLNVKIYDENGYLVAEDDDVMKVAVAKVTPRWSGTFFVRITMVDSVPAGASWYMLTAQAPYYWAPPSPKQVKVVDDYYMGRFIKPRTQAEIEAYFRPYWDPEKRLILDKYGRSAYTAAAIVYFDVGKDTIKAESYPILNEWGRALNGYLRRGIFMVEGHTDSTGDAGANQKLSERRAISVVNYLVKKFGITPSRLRAKGFGQRFPVSSNATEAGRADNRRVQFTLIGWEE